MLDFEEMSEPVRGYIGWHIMRFCQSLLRRCTFEVVQ